MNGTNRSPMSLPRSEALWGLDSRLLDLVPVAVYFCDADGVLVRWNRSAADLWGREPIAGDRTERFCGSYKLYRPDGTFMAHADCPVADALRLRVPQRVPEAIIERPDGSRRYIMANIDPILDSAGELLGAVNVLQDVTERKQAEEERSRAERRFLRLLEMIPAAAYTRDPGGQITAFNRRAAELWGREPRTGDPAGGEPHGLLDAEGKPVPHGRPWMACALVESSQCEDRELTIERSDGSRRTVLAYAAPFHDDAGAVGGTVEVLVDVTDRKRAEEALRESEEKFRQLAETIEDVFWVGEPRGRRVLYVSPAYARVWGRPCEALYADFSEWLSGVHADDRSRVQAAFFSGVLEGRYDEEYRVVRPDGTIRWVRDRGFPIRNGAGVATRVVGTAEDITARKQAEARLDAVLSSINDHLVCYDREWRYTFVNDRAAQVLGKSKEELLGRSIWEVFPEAVGNPYYRQLHEAFAEQRVIRSEHFYAPFKTWFENHIYPTPDGVTVFSADVTARKQLEAQVEERNEQLVEADRRKDEFLAMLAHELRNPLAPIRAALHVIGQRGAERDVVTHARDVAERQVAHMSRLLDDLLDVSRISRGRIELRRELLDLRAVVNRSVEAVRPLCDERGHLLTVALPSAPIRVDGDPTRLEQVVTNLLNNAAKYTDPSGSISLDVECEAGAVVLRVRDTGIGLASDMLEKVFDLFVQAERRLDRSRGGVGIGLTLVKKLVEQHGGAIVARSEGPGRGSEFVVRLPAAPDGVPLRAADASQVCQPPPPRQYRRVLVVDDNVDAADSLAMVLESEGHDVRVAYDGPSAVETARDFRPGVILLDIGLPGMDGYEVARRLRAEEAARTSVLVALTGWGQEEDRRRSQVAGFDHHLVKPVDPLTLIELLA